MNDKKNKKDLWSGSTEYKIKKPVDSSVLKVEKDGRQDNKQLLFIIGGAVSVCIIVLLAIMLMGGSDETDTEEDTKLTDPKKDHEVGEQRAVFEDKEAGRPESNPEEAALRSDFAKMAKEEGSENILNMFDELTQKKTDLNSILPTKKIPLLVIADHDDKFSGKDANALITVKAERGPIIFDVPIILAVMLCGRQSGIEFSPVLFVRPGTCFSDYFNDIKPKSDYIMLVSSSPREAASFGVHGGLQSNWLSMAVLEVKTTAILDAQRLLAMASFTGAQVQNGKVSSSVLLPQVIEDFEANVSGIGLGKIQSILHGNVIRKELAKCEKISAVKTIKPEAIKKKGGQTTNTQIKVPFGQYTVLLDAPQGNPDRCWELDNEQLRAELPPGKYTIYIYDKKKKEMHRLSETSLAADKEYILLK